MLNSSPSTVHFVDLPYSLVSPGLGEAWTHMPMLSNINAHREESIVNEFSRRVVTVNVNVPLLTCHCVIVMYYVYLYTSLPSYFHCTIKLIADSCHLSHLLTFISSRKLRGKLCIFPHTMIDMITHINTDKR